MTSDYKRLKAWQSKLARALGECSSEQESERVIAMICAHYTVDMVEVQHFLSVFAQAFEMAQEAHT